MLACVQLLCKEELGAHGLEMGRPAHFQFVIVRLGLLPREKRLVVCVQNNVVAQSLPKQRKIQGFRREFPIFPILSCVPAGLNPKLRGQLDLPVQ